MDLFKHAHVTASKKLKNRKGFRNKVKNLLTKKVPNDGVSIQEQLNSSKLGVRRVDVSSLKANAKTNKKNKFIEAQFINDVTSKILESVEDGPDQPFNESDISEENNQSKIESGAEFLKETTKTSTASCVKFLQEKPVQQSLVKPLNDNCISTDTFIVTAQMEHIDHETDNTGVECATLRVKSKMKKRIRKIKSSKTASGASIYASSRKDTIQSISSMNCQEECIDKQLVMTRQTEAHSMGSLKKRNLVNYFEVPKLCENTALETPLPETMTLEANFDFEPLIIESQGGNTNKEKIVKRLENVARNKNLGSFSTTEIAINLRKVLCLNNPNDSKTTSTSVIYTEENSDGKKSKTLATDQCQTLATEGTISSDTTDVSATLQTSSTTQTKPALLDSNVDEVQTPNIDFHNLPNDRFLLVLRNGEPVYIRGSVTISVIAGCAEILGSKLLPEAQPKKYTVFSPRGVSLISIQPCLSNNSFLAKSVMYSLCADSQPCVSLMSALQTKCEALRPTLQRKDCILLLQKTNSKVVEYSNLHMPNKLFPSSASLMKVQRQHSFAETALECEFLPKNIDENVKLFCEKEEWESLSDAVVCPNIGNGTKCTLICGGKGVGKSTLLRFLINRSLASHEKVLCLDFDLGQAEFTMPGCISAVIVDRPLLGPNFTHLLQPERMIFLGDVNVSFCLVPYLKGMKHIIDFCRSKEEFKNIPWFVNTMGYCQGLGFELMMKLLLMICPSDVVQIQSQYNKRNFTRLLDAQFVQNYRSSLRSFTCEKSDLSYNLHVVPSAAESKSIDQEAPWGLDARTMRDIVIMSYLSSIVPPPYFNLTEVVPVACSFENLQLCVTHETIQPNKILSIMNGNIVALCVSDETDVLQSTDPTLPQVLSHVPICCCLGFGILRGVDMPARQLFLISPLSIKEMQRINCLVMGRLQIPSCVLLKSAISGTVGHIPYTVIGPGQPTGRLSMKSPFNLVLSSVA